MAGKGDSKELLSRSAILFSVGKYRILNIELCVKYYTIFYLVNRPAKFYFVQDITEKFSFPSELPLLSATAFH